MLIESPRTEIFIPSNPYPYPGYSHFTFFCISPTHFASFSYQFASFPPKKCFISPTVCCIFPTKCIISPTACCISLRNFGIKFCLKFSRDWGIRTYKSYVQLNQGWPMWKTSVLFIKVKTSPQAKRRLSSLLWLSWLSSLYNFHLKINFITG